MSDFKVAIIMAFTMLILATVTGVLVVAILAILLL
jgi:hypothetical protein